MKKDFSMAVVALCVSLFTLGWVLTPAIGAQVDVNTRLRDFLAGQRGTVTVTSGTTAAFTSTYIVLACTGAQTINTFTGGTVGMVVYLENTDTNCTIADDDVPTAANAVNLTGVATSDVGAVGKVVELIYTGSSWLEVGESAN